VPRRASISYLSLAASRSHRRRMSTRPATSGTLLLLLLLRMVGWLIQYFGPLIHAMWLAAFWHSSRPNNKLQKRSFEFQHVFGMQSTQDEVYAEACDLVAMALEGFNVCILAYGQTGTSPSADRATRHEANHSRRVVTRWCA